MLVLLAGIHTGPACIAGAHVENEVRPEGVYPASTIVPARRTARGGSDLSYRVQNRHPLFGIAEENVVAVTETVINPHLKTVGVVRRGPVLDEIAGGVPCKIRSRRIRLQELLHRAKNQALGDFVAGGPLRLVLLLLGVGR